MRLETYVKILDNVNFARVLPNGADRDTMATVAVHILNQDLGTTGLEGDTVVTVVDNAVLNDDIRRTVRVPAIGILRFVLASRVASDVEVVEDDICTVGQEVIPLRRVAKVKV